MYVFMYFEKYVFVCEYVYIVYFVCVLVYMYDYEWQCPGTLGLERRNAKTITDPGSAMRQQK